MTAADEHSPLLRRQAYDDSGVSRSNSNRTKCVLAAGCALLAVFAIHSVFSKRHDPPALSRYTAFAIHTDFATSHDPPALPRYTLQLQQEEKMAALFATAKPETKYETSSVLILNVNDTTSATAYAICDSSWAIYQFGVNDLTPTNPHNLRITDASVENHQARKHQDSGYEALAYLDHTFYVVRESVAMYKAQTYHAVIEEIDVHGKHYNIKRSCPTEFTFEGDSKGFEGIWAVHDTDHQVVLWGLCEGNHCSESKKDDRGHGRIVLMKQVMSGTNCTWKTVGVVDLPQSVYFADYSAMAVRANDNTVAIASQEDSQVWIGRVLGRQPDSGLWDLDGIAFDDTNAEMWSFPKNVHGEVVYCNIEGIYWMDNRTLMAASDKTKGHGKQPSRCKEKDQSIHIFNMPA